MTYIWNTETQKTHQMKNAKEIIEYLKSDSKEIEAPCGTIYNPNIDEDGEQSIELEFLLWVGMECTYITVEIDANQYTEVETMENPSTTWLDVTDVRLISIFNDEVYDIEFTPNEATAIIHELQNL